MDFFVLDIKLHLVTVTITVPDHVERFLK